MFLFFSNRNYNLKGRHIALEFGKKGSTLVLLDVDDVENKKTVTFIYRLI